MLKTFANLFKIPELRARIFFTIGLVAVARLLAIIPTPGVDWGAIQQLQDTIGATSEGGLVAWFDTFTGGALTQCSVGTLSIWPYISAQIIIQLMTAVIPALGRLQREGDAGRKTLNLYIRWLTIAICVFQALALANTMLSPERLVGSETDVRLVVMSPFLFYVSTVIAMTGASMFVMWLGDQISERGIGNGISLLIMINITSRLPVAVADAARRYFNIGGAQAQGAVWELILLLVFFFAVLLGTVAITQALRKIPIHSTRAISRGAAYGGGVNYLPLRVNFSGVMPIIFAGPILQLIGMLSRLNGTNAVTRFLKEVGETIIQPTTMTHILLYGALILFFTFFWVATQFNAMNISDGLKREGSYIPGIRPGLATAEYLDAVMTRVTFIGAIALLLIAIIPLILTSSRQISWEITSFFGGTSLLIIVGVALDTLRRLESQLVMRNYDGFLKHGRITGRH